MAPISHQHRTPYNDHSPRTTTSRDTPHVSHRPRGVIHTIHHLSHLLQTPNHKHKTSNRIINIPAIRPPHPLHPHNLNPLYLRPSPLKPNNAIYIPPLHLDAQPKRLPRLRPRSHHDPRAPRRPPLRIILSPPPALLLPSAKRHLTSPYQLHYRRPRAPDPGLCTQYPALRERKLYSDNGNGCHSADTFSAF